MAELKTKKTTASVDEFLASIEDERRRKDGVAMVEIMKKATKSEPTMWGNAIVGFGDRVLRYDNGKELDWFAIGFSPRKAGLVLYMSDAVEKQKKDFDALGKYTAKGGYVHIKKLDDVDTAMLSKIIGAYVESSGTL